MDIKVYIKEQAENQLIPKPLRCLIVGTSGSGKTNLLLNFIYNDKVLPFKNLYVFSRSITQTAYTNLRDLYSKVGASLGRQIAYFYSSCDDLITVDECEPYSLVVFDDCLLEKQTPIKDYFIRGRHKHISCVYLSQSYGRVDMQVIRNNINLLCVFNQNKHYSKRIYEDFVGSDMSYIEFEFICKQCWSHPHGFISIDTTKKPHKGKYKCMLKQELMPMGRMHNKRS